METIVDFSDRFCEVRDQGKRNTCLAFATTAARELHHGLNRELCVEWLYYYTVKYAGDSPGDGIYIPDVSSALKIYGQPLEEVWEYKVIHNYDNWDAPKDPKPLYHANGVFNSFASETIVDSLKEYVPVIITIATDFAFQFPTIVNGYAIVEHDPKYVKDMLHAVLIVGFGIIQDRKYFNVRNSWGEKWGKNGYAWLSEKFLDVNAYEILRLQKQK